MNKKEPVFGKEYTNSIINCVSCGGEMYEVYSKQDGGYTHVQCGDCGHVMKLGTNQNDGRLKKPNASHPNNKE
jgi:ribosomal protein L37E